MNFCVCVGCNANVFEQKTNPNKIFLLVTITTVSSNHKIFGCFFKYKFFIKIYWLLVRINNVVKTRKSSQKDSSKYNETGRLSSSEDDSNLDLEEDIDDNSFHNQFDINNENVIFNRPGQSLTSGQKASNQRLTSPTYLILVPLILMLIDLIPQQIMAY